MTGCASNMNYRVGTQSLTQENINTIKKGTTTQANILSLFGEPMSKIQSGTLGTMWTYSRCTRKDSFKFSGTRTEMSSYGLTVIFDDNGIVKDYSSVTTNPMQTATITFDEK